MTTVVLALMALLQAPAVEDPLPVTVGFVATGAHLPVIVAKERGLFAKWGLKPESTLMKSERELVKAFREGKVEVACLSSADVFDMECESPGSVTLLSRHEVVAIGVVARKERGFRTGRDLKGRRVGVLPSRGDEAMVRAALHRLLGAEGLASVKPAIDCAALFYKP